MRYQHPLTIPITLVRESGEPLHEQIASQVGSAVEQGLLTGGCRLPSTRCLAELLGVSRGVVTTAYDRLFTHGYLQSRSGSGTYVAPRRPDPVPPGPLRPPARRAAPVDLRPGQPGPEAFPLAAWRAAWRQAGFRRPPVHALPSLGLPELRHAVAAHVARGHGVSLAGHEVVVTGGSAHGLRLVLDALGISGTHVAAEEPLPPALHRALGTGPDAPVPLTVDAAGADLTGVPAGCQAIVLSPDGQVPLGTVMSPGRRLDAAAWTLGGGHLIKIAPAVPARPDAGPPPRLLSLAPGRSIVLGGFCQLLTPTLKLGYAIVPRTLADTLAQRIRDRAEQPPYVTQLAVAALLRDGTLTRLAHRLSALHARKSRLVDAALGAGAAQSGAARTGAARTGAVAGPVAGVDVAGREAADTRVLYLPPWLDAGRATDELASRGIRVHTLAPYHFSRRAAPSALVIGFGHLTDETLRRALPIVREVLTGGLP